MTLIPYLVLGLVFVAASHFIPKFVAQKFGPGLGLSVGVLGIACLLTLAFRVERLGVLDAIALGVLVRGVIAHYREYGDAQIIARGEAAIAVSEARK